MPVIYALSSELNIKLGFRMNESGKGPTRSGPG